MKKIIVVLTILLAVVQALPLGTLAISAQEPAPAAKIESTGNPIPDTLDQPVTGDAPSSGDAPSTQEPPTSDLPPEPPVPADGVYLLPPKSLRAGEAVTFTFRITGTNLRATQGSITYDPALFTYVGCTTLAEDWEINYSNEIGTLKYLGLSTENVGLNGPSPLFSVTFLLTEGTPKGTRLPFELSEATAYNGESELILPGSSPVFQVTRPLSTACSLSTLSLSGTNLTPAFSPEITEYSATLPFSAYYADIRVAADLYAQVKLNSRKLEVGENIIRITVIAESGVQQVYTLKITRLADPNYIPSSDNRILSLGLSAGLLFPAFSPEITEYTVYLVKGQDVTLTPQTADKAVAKGITIPAQRDPDAGRGEDTAGEFFIDCHAEDGSPRRYVFHTILLDTPEELNRVEHSITDESPLTVILIFAFAAVTVFFLGFVASHLIHARNDKQISAVPQPPAAPPPADDAAPPSDTDSSTPPTA